MKRLKVLISAYACRPNMGSDPGIGWNIAKELVKQHDVWVLTRNDNRPFIEAELASNPIPGLNFVYYDLPAWALWWKQGLRGVQFHYYLWQIGVYFLAQKLHSEINFDVVHHVTYVKHWSPSFLALLPVPFIWGPVGGGESAPRVFCRDFSVRGQVYETMRDLARWVGERDPFVRMTAQRSYVGLAATDETAKRLSGIGCESVQISGVAGLSNLDLDLLASLPSTEQKPFRFISIGRLLHWKGFHLGLRAFAQANLADAEYWLIGTGPEEKQLQSLVSELNIAPQVKFWGALPREETLHKLGESHVLVHPSLHDSGGWVCLEAMAAGRPVICLDLGGPATQITEETGCKIPAHDPEQAVRDLASSMVCLAKDSELHVRMGQAGQKRVREVYSWETKGETLAQLYAEILAVQ